MPRLVFSNKFWSMLEKILLQEAIHNKRNLRMTIYGMLYECGLVVRGETDLMHLEAGDGSHVKAYQHSAGAGEQGTTGAREKLCKNTTKIHLVVDSYGLLVEFEIPSGEVNGRSVADIAWGLCRSGI